VSDLKDKHWLELCEAASREQDPEKLLELIRALNDALERIDLQEKTKRACSLAQLSVPYSARRSFAA
jgi:hypothetical protein